MTLLDLLELVVIKLTQAGIPYMVSGSLASTYHGEPRTTQVVDIVIDPSHDQLERFVESLDRDRFYVGDAQSAFERRDQFNVIDTASGWKIDLIVRKDRPFSRAEFERRTAVDLDRVATFVSTPEDTILAKLEWGRLGESDRQMRDVIGVIAVSGNELDLAYLHRWADELGLRADLDHAMKDAQAG